MYIFHSRMAICRVARKANDMPGEPNIPYSCKVLILGQKIGISEGFSLHILMYVCYRFGKRKWESFLAIIAKIFKFPHSKFGKRNRQKMLFINCIHMHMHAQ